MTIQRGAATRVGLERAPRRRTPPNPAQAPAVLTSLPSISVSMSEPRSSARTPAKTKATDVEDDRQMTSPARATRRATAKTPAKTTAKTPARSTRASAKKDKPHKPKDPVGFLLKYLLVVFLFIGVARVFNGPFPMELRLKENIAAKRAELFERAEHARATKEKIQAATPSSSPPERATSTRCAASWTPVTMSWSAPPGETPLHASGIRGAPEVVEALLSPAPTPTRERTVAPSSR